MSWNQSSFTKSSKGCQYFVSRFGPDESLGMLVMCVDVVSNGCFKFTGAAKYAASNLFFREQREPAFHQIDPGSSGRGEVQMETRALEQPSVDGR